MSSPPITGAIMHRLVGVWSGDDFESRLMLAATCVGYFGFMRASEFLRLVQPLPAFCCLRWQSTQNWLPLRFACGSAELRPTPLVGVLRYFWECWVLQFAQSQP